MAGRGRSPPAPMPNSGAPGLLPDPIIPPAGGGAIAQARPSPASVQQLPPSMVLIEHKMATQHAEIQKLLTENQRLAAAHLALRQELTNARQDVQYLQQQMSRMQMEEEHRMFSLIEKAGKLEEELRAAEPLKAELQRVHNDAQQLGAERHELMGHIHQMTQELQKSHEFSQQAAAFESENENLRQELESSRVSCEKEKEAQNEHEEQKKAMEETLILLAKEVEKLHTDLANEKRVYNTGGHGESYNFQHSMETPYAQSHNFYNDAFSSHEEGASALLQHRKSAEELVNSTHTKAQMLQEASNASPHPVQSSVSLFSPENMSQIWKAHSAPNGRTFYYNVITGETQWEVPAELIASSNVQNTGQSQNYSIQQSPQAHIAQWEQTEFRQVQLQQFADRNYHSNNSMPHPQGQHHAHVDLYQNSSPVPLQQAQPQNPTQPAGQGHMHQLAAQMNQLVQGQFPYNTPASQYGMGSQSPYSRAPSEYHT